MNQTIMLIRHAEKPIADQPGAGVTEEGAMDSESLTIRGWQRAGGLAASFARPFAPVVVPRTIFASGVMKRDGTGSRSKRPLQTVTPLARVLGLEPATDFSKGQESDLAGRLRDAPLPTLVCWQHESIPAIALAIIGQGNVAPDNWPDPVFDAIWLLRRDDASSPWSFSEHYQQILAGDRGP